MHERLQALGHYPTGLPDDTFNELTVAAVEAFQRSRGLPISGDVDATTWSRLIEAGWRLGQRLLFLARPNLRGDDVAELQVRLSQLGFNPGRIDGIFGHLLDVALRDFQRNCAIEPTGTLTRETLLELVRLTSYGPDRSLVSEARDLAGFDVAPTGPVVVCGSSPLAALLVRHAASLDTALLRDQSPEEVAAFANSHQAAAVISVETLEQIDGVHLHYWASYRSHSRRGEQLASAIAASLARSQQLARVEVTGMALPILRETQMTTLHVEHSPSPAEELEELAKVILAVLVEVIHR